MKKLITLFSVLCLTLALTVPASALEYNIDGPGDPHPLHRLHGGHFRPLYIAAATSPP